MDKWRNESTNKLFKAFTLLINEEEVANFCRDLMTEAELGIFNSAHSYEIYHTVNSGTVNLKSLILSIPTTKVI
jgi:uncharacterized protein YerC